MAHFNWRAAALVALTSSAFAAYAVAREPSSGSQGKSGSSQSSSKSSQGQSQASDSNNNTNSSNAQSNTAQGSRDANSSQNQPSQDRSNQNRDDRSSANSASDRNSSSNSRARDDRADRDSARSDLDDRATTRDRSSRDADRNTDSRSRRGNMRGPDIGIWFNRSSGDGLVISDVSSKGAIAKLGFREADRIVSVDGRRVTREDEFMDFLLHGNARRVKVIVLRDNREETIFVEPALLVDDRESAEVDPLERLGIVVDDRYDDRIVVWRVIPRSPAYYAGFHPGDVIVTFGDRPYRTRTEFERGSRDWKAGDVNVQVRRGDRTRDLSVEIPNLVRVDRRNDRMERRDERTAQRNPSDTPDQGDANRSDRNNNDSRDNNRRGGILDRVRGNR